MFRNILKTTLRSIVKNPLHSAINIFGLTIGLAAVFMLFNWMNYHSNFDSFHENSEKIYKLMRNERNSTGNVVTSEGAVFKVMEQAQSTIPTIDGMTRLISSWRWPSRLCFKLDANKDCLYQKGIYADSSFFELFDFEIVNGHENPIIKPFHIAISESMARKLYGDEEAVGKPYLLDTWIEVEIAAVFKDLPTNSSLQFDFVGSLELFSKLTGQKVQSMQEYSFITYVSVSDPNIAQVEQQLNTLPVMLENQNSSYFLHSLKEEHLYSTFSDGKPADGIITYIKVFLLFILFILIMSAINFVNLSTAKATTRGKEIGVRKVTGATKGSIMWQFLFEGLCKVLIATMLGLILAHQLNPLANYYLQEKIPFAISGEMILGLAIIVIFCTVLSAGYPAFVMSRYNPISSLKNKGNQYSGPDGLRKWLTTFQMSFSVVIVLVTAIIYLQVEYIQSRTIGYEKEGLMQLEPTYQHQKNFESFKNDLLSSHLIKGVGISNQNLLNANYSSDQFSWPGKTEDENITFKVIGGDAALIETLGIKVIEGSNFSETDSAIQVVLSNKSVEIMALEEPVGAEILYSHEKVKVVGVIEDFNTDSFHKELMPTIIYKIPVRQSGTFYIRFDQGNAKEALAHIEASYNKYEKFFTMQYELLDKEFEEQYQQEQVLSKISSFIMIISVIIALVGVIGLLTYNLVRRYKEIGIRKVFGASTASIVFLVSKEFIYISLLANILAWPVAWYISNLWLKNFAYRIDIPYSIFALGLILVFGFVMILISVQSFKTAMMNPAEVVKDE